MSDRIRSFPNTHIERHLIWGTSEISVCFTRNSLNMLFPQWRIRNSSPMLNLEWSTECCSPTLSPPPARHVHAWDQCMLGLRCLPCLLESWATTAGQQGERWSRTPSSHLPLCVPMLDTPRKVLEMLIWTRLDLAIHAAANLSPGQYGFRTRTIHD